MPHGIPLVGDATSDEVLKQAGVERARGLVTLAASDADNLYIVMSARFLNDKLFIVARAEEEGAEKKLLRAGANRVVSPYFIGGQRVALAVLRPAVMDFIELATRKEHLELQIEETEIQAGSRLAGRTLRDSQVRQELGAIIVAIKKPDGCMQFNLAAEAIRAEGRLITMGHRISSTGSRSWRALEGASRFSACWLPSSAVRGGRCRGHEGPEDQDQARDVGPQHQGDREGQRAVEGLEVHPVQLTRNAYLALPTPRRPRARPGARRGCSPARRGSGGRSGRRAARSAARRSPWPSSPPASASPGCSHGRRW
jgi:Trk K+ transport system NAD-binding subunit